MVRTHSTWVITGILDKPLVKMVTIRYIYLTMCRMSNFTEVLAVIESSRFQKLSYHLVQLSTMLLGTLTNMVEVAPEMITSKVLMGSREIGKSMVALGMTKLLEEMALKEITEQKVKVVMI